MRIVLESEGFEILGGEIALLPADPDERSKETGLEVTSVPFVGNTVSEWSINQPGEYIPVLVNLKVRRNGQAETAAVEGLSLPTVTINREDIKNQEYSISVPAFGRLQVRVVDSQDRPLPGESVEISWPNEIAGGQTDANGDFQLFLTVGLYWANWRGESVEVIIRSFEDARMVFRRPTRKDEIR